MPQTPVRPSSIALYLPRVWTDDHARRSAAGIPTTTSFRSTIELAEQLLARAFDAGVPASWVVADSGYDSFRRWLEEHGRSSLVTVRRSNTVHVVGRRQTVEMIGAQLIDADWTMVEGTAGVPSQAWACIPLHESILAELQGQPVNIMRIEEWSVPDYYELLLVTNESIVNDQPEVVEKLVRALTRGYADAAADPTAAVDELVKANPETNRELETKGMQLLTPLWTDNGSVDFGAQTEERWQSYADWLRQQGILTTDVPVEQAFTNDFVQRAGQ